MQNLKVFCADIGSIAKNKFGWAGISIPNEEPSVTGSDINKFVEVISSALVSDRRASVGFECPLFVPIPKDPKHLTSARNGEGNRAWFAGAGCGALAIGLTETTWILQEIKTRISEDIPIFFEWSEFESKEKGLHIWEAFVTAEAKGNSHRHDAEIALEAFNRAMPNPDGENAINENSVFSLISASAIRAGWKLSPSSLAKPCLVIRA